MITPEKHVAKDGSVTWKVRFRHGLNRSGTGPRQTSERFDTKREAQQFVVWLDALGSQGALDELYAHEQRAAVPTLDALAEEWIDLRPSATEGTRLNYQRLWGRTWSPLIGHLPANRVDGDDLSRAVRQLGARYSHKSLKNQQGLLSGVLSRAVEKGYLAQNPALRLPLPDGTTRSGDDHEMRILTYEEFAGVEARIGEHYRPFVRTLYATGLRFSEAIALRPADWAAPNIMVRRALKWSPDNRREFGPPKTKAGRRTVTVTAELHDALDAAKARGGEFLFTAPRGGMILHRTFWSRVWLPAVSHLEPRPRIHDLRHSHASVLLARGIPPHVVSRRLGHTNITVTVNTYGHLMPDAQMLAAEASAFTFAELES